MNSCEQKHIQIDLDKGIINDFHPCGSGGTIIDLLKQFGASIHSELKKGKNGVPEFLPIWILGKDWRKHYNCEELIIMLRRDRKLIWLGVIYSIS